MSTNKEKLNKSAPKNNEQRSSEITKATSTTSKPPVTKN